MRAPASPSRWSDLRVDGDRPSARRGRDRIVRVFAGDRLEDRDRILHRARHRPGDVGEQAQRHHAGAAGQAHRGADAGERLVGRGPRIELPVSLPSPMAPKLAATAAAVPPLDPAVTRSSAYGLRE